MSVCLTVFTPTYNRGYIIENLYRSLQKQAFKNFEWIVVNDGSTDNTDELFAKWNTEDNFFPIRYLKVENGGKHLAINKGVEMAVGRMFFIVDSDDYLPDDALEQIVEVEKSIPETEKSHFAGVCGCKGYTKDRVVGKTYSKEGFLDITSLERSKFHIEGDKAEVFYTDILKKYPFPAFEGENFITECVVWDKIAFAGYKLRFFNKIVCICNYLPDGLTAKGKNLFVENPQGWGLYLYQSALYGKLKRMSKWRAFYDYYAFNKGKKGFLEISKILHINPLVFLFGIFVLRIFYRFYR